MTASGQNRSINNSKLTTADSFKTAVQRCAPNLPVSAASNLSVCSALLELFIWDWINQPSTSPPITVNKRFKLRPIREF